MTAAFDPTTAKPVAVGGFDPSSARPIAHAAAGGFDPASAKPVGGSPVLGAVGNAAKTVATGVGNALDAQRFGVAKLLTGKDNTDDQRTAERQAVGTQGIYDALGHIPLVGHALQGASDVVQDTVTDPLTYETLGAGPALKALGLGAKAAEATGAIGKAITDTPAGALLHDTLNWGGEVTRTHGKSTTNTIRGALNKASTTGAQTTAEYKRLSQGIIDGLSDDEKMNVRKALNGELPPPVTPHQLYRFQNTAGPAEYSPGRTATFYAMGKPAEQSAGIFKNNSYEKQLRPDSVNPTGGGGVVGGNNLITDEYAPHNALELPPKRGSVGLAIIEKFYGADQAKEISRSARRIEQGEYGSSEAADEFAKELGLHPSDRTPMTFTPGAKEEETPWEQSLFSDQSASSIVDRLGVEVARQKGYDAAIMKGAHAGGTDQFVRLYPKGESPFEKEADKVQQLTPKEAQAYNGLRGITERDYKDRTRTMLAEKYNEIAERLSPEHRTALATALRTETRPTDGQLADVYDSLLHQTKEAMPYRQNYAPTKHQPVLESLEEGREAKPRVAGEQFDTRNLQREQVPTTEPGQLMEGFDALSSNAGKMANKRVIQESLGTMMNDPAIKKLITDAGRATGEKRTDVQKVGDAWLKVIGYPRAATVSLTPRHAANIIDLASNTIPPAQFPGYMKNVITLAAKLVRATPEETADLLKDGRDLGAISQDFAEHKPFFQNVPGLKHWTAANNKLVWAVDSASKQEYAKLIKAAHPEMNDLEAGGQASERLVDYANTSPAVKALRYIAPFGTFRGSIPGAVAGGVIRNPARAAFLNRATGGTAFGGKPAKGQPGAEFYGPTADIARGIDAPGDFLRGTLGQPVQAGATVAGEALTGNPGASAQTTAQELRDLPGQIMRGEFSKMGQPGKVSPYAKAVALRTARFLNYSHPMDLQFLTDWAASGVPEAQAVLEMLGKSQFPAPTGNPVSGMANEALRQSTGVSVR